MSRNLVVPSLKKKSAVLSVLQLSFLQQHQGRSTILLFQPERGLYQQKKAPEFVSALCKYYSQHQWCYCKVPPRCVIGCTQTGGPNALNDLVILLTQHRRLAAGARKLILLTTIELLVLCTVLEGIWHSRKL